MNKTYFFVDYENVHEAGLAGMNTLPAECEVHLFYSLNANKINLDLLRFVKARLEVHRVKPGKQSLDMQMVSYLGCCIGAAGREGTFILVSKDTDYANTVLFWREEGVEVRVQPAILEEKNSDGMERALKSVKVTRRGRRGGRRNSASQQESTVKEDAAAVTPEAPKPLEAQKPKEEEKPADTLKAPEAAKPQETAGPAERAEAEKSQNEGEKPSERSSRGRRRNTRSGESKGEQSKENVTEKKADAPAAEQPAETKPEAEVKTDGKAEEKAKTSRGRRGGRPRKTNADTAPETAAKPDEQAVKAPAEPEKKQPEKPAPQNTHVPDEPAKVTVTVHDVPMVTHAVPQAKPEKSPAAARVQAALAEKKTDPAIARKVASIVQKHEGEKNSRQAVYMEIRRTFGQKMGVDLYNSVKGLLK